MLTAVHGNAQTLGQEYLGTALPACEVASVLNGMRECFSAVHARPHAQVRYLGRMRVVSVSCGANHTLAITESGELLACGRGRYGQLGLGNFQDQISLRQIYRLACAPSPPNAPVHLPNTSTQFCCARTAPFLAQPLVPPVM